MKRIDIQTGHRYKIYVERGLLDHPEETLIEAFGGEYPKIAIITDSAVDELYAAPLLEKLLAAGYQAAKFAFENGEISKNLDIVRDVYGFLSRHEMTRRDYIIAVGGGVVGDLAGFAAATWLRGISFIQVPTTLLAMVDSSVGGKTGVDIPEGKNLVGAFWQPSLVLCDPDTLKTLTPEMMACGMAEVIKYGAIFDEPLFEQLMLPLSDSELDDVIRRCIVHKKNVVESDERDTGQRQLLNFGHTLGHAIEKHTEFGVPHGQAVAIGMIMMCSACEKMGLTPKGTAERIADCCRKNGLPTEIDAPFDELCAYCMGDKKRSGAKLTLVTLEKLGKAVLTTIPARSLFAFMRGNSMSECTFSAAKLTGRVTAPPSKSMAHRALVCAALTAHENFPDGDNITVRRVSSSRDMEATLNVLEGLGARFSRDGDSVVFYGLEKQAGDCDNITLPCGESGSTLRFLLPVAAALGLKASFTCEGRLSQRPMEPLVSLMAEHGVSFSAHTLPFSITGQLTHGAFSLPGDVSSQFVSGLMFALPMLDGDSDIIMTSPLQSAGYVDMTVQALCHAGITIEKTADGWHIPGGQRYQSHGGTVEGDWSNAAFWLCAGALGADIRVYGLRMDSTQGDKAVLDVLRKFGAKPVYNESERCVEFDGHPPLEGIRIDAGPIPDLAPILSVCAAFAGSSTEIHNAARLRLKESDRISSMCSLLKAIGAQVDEYQESMVVHGCGGAGKLAGGHVDGANDHRVVMSAAIAALFCKGEVTMTDCEAVQKSYPEFYREYHHMGGICNGINMGKLL